MRWRADPPGGARWHDAAPPRRRPALPAGDALLLTALRTAPRRYRMPPLPANARAAAAAGSDTALAFAIEAARAGTAGPAIADLFTAALAGLLARSLAAGGGDPSFQALLLRKRSSTVAEYGRLAASEAVDVRALRAAVNAIAHPGKLRALSPGRVREALAQLHGLARAAEWTRLRPAVEALLPHVAQVAGTQAALHSIMAGTALQRRERAAALLADADVRQYMALCERHGPPAGSAQAGSQGRASARLGSDAEAATLHALRTIAALLDGLPPARRHRVVSSLLTPRGFPGARKKAKDEWDAALLHADAAGGGDAIVLLVEVKASPAGAAPDLSRLLRGLERLALDAGAVYPFACAQGEARILGESLRALQPRGQVPPAHVVYCCGAAATPPQPLGAATKAVLLAEPASIAFAQRLQRGEAPPHTELLPVWASLTTAPHLRPALHQYQTAVTAREAMLHPDDLLAAVRAQLAP